MEPRSVARLRTRRELAERARGHGPAQEKPLREVATLALEKVPLRGGFNAIVARERAKTKEGKELPTSNFSLPNRQVDGEERAAGRLILHDHFAA